MAPIFAETQCLTCHAKQGYVEGQAQGGISVRFDITDETQGMAWTDFYVMLLTLILVGLLIVIMYIFVRGLMRKLKIAIHRIEELAVTDELTGAFNRRYLFE